MKKTILLASTTLLSACISTSPSNTANMPEKIEHNGEIYHLANQQNLGEMQRYFYLPQGETTKKWQSAVDILVDLNPENSSLAKRIELRKKAFKNNRIELFDLTEKDNWLYAYVIYPPNDKENNWQIDVAKGKNANECGFTQFQHSIKIEKTAELAKMKQNKLQHYLKKQTDKEMANLSQLNWTCHPFDHKTS